MRPTGPETIRTQRSPYHVSAATTRSWQAVAPDGRSVLIVENDTNLALLEDPTGGDPESIELRAINDPPTWQRVTRR